MRYLLLIPAVVMMLVAVVLYLASVQYVWPSRWHHIGLFVGGVISQFGAMYIAGQVSA